MQEITGELIHQDGDICLKSGDSLLHCVFPDNLLDKALFYLRNHGQVTLCGKVTQDIKTETDFTAKVNVLATVTVSATDVIEVQSIGIQGFLDVFKEEAF